MSPVELYYRYARVTEIYEEASEIQKLVISNAILREHKESFEAPDVTWRTPSSILKCELREEFADKVRG